MMTSVTKTSIFFAVSLIALLGVFFFVVMEWAKGINDDESYTPRYSFRGGLSKANGNVTSLMSNGGTTSNSSNQSSVCLVSFIDVEDEDEDENNKDDDIIICNPVTASYNTGVDDAFFLLPNLDRSVINSNRQALLRNEWFIEYSQDWVAVGDEQQKILQIPEHQDVQTIDPSYVPHHQSIDPSHRRRLAASLEERRRKLAGLTGKRTVVVVAIDLQYTKQELYDYVFGSNISLTTQMDACSQSQLAIVPHPDFPVIRISPPKRVSQYTFVDLYTAILEDIKKELGVREGDSVTSTTDHLLLVVPDSIDRRPGELGWGSTPGFFAGIIESLAPVSWY